MRSRLLPALLVASGPALAFGAAADMKVPEIAF